MIKCTRVEIRFNLFILSFEMSNLGQARGEMMKRGNWIRNLMVFHSGASVTSTLDSIVNNSFHLNPTMKESHGAVEEEGRETAMVRRNAYRRQRAWWRGILLVAHVDSSFVCEEILPKYICLKKERAVRRSGWSGKKWYRQ